MSFINDNCEKESASEKGGKRNKIEMKMSYLGKSVYDKSAQMGGRIEREREMWQIYRE